MKLQNVNLYDSTLKKFVQGTLSVENGKIQEITYQNDVADGDLIIPGLVDVHTHGRGGFDYNTATLEQMKTMKRLYAEQGVTTVVPTLASDTLDNLISSIEKIREAGYTAVHMEGRYLNEKRRGAHAAHLIAPLTASEVALLREAAGDMHLHISASYELDQSGEFLKAAKENGATAGLAHTDATYDQAMTAVQNGVISFTHLFNAMPPVHHRAGGAVMAGLISDAYTEIICDGFHLAPETVRLVKTAKDPSRVVLITDSMEGTGCPDGEYSIAGNPVYLKGGKAYTIEGAIAGSTLELLDGVKNYANFSAISFEEALPAATVNPATMLSLEGVGTLKEGNLANFVRLAPDFTIKEVYVGGERIK